MVKLGAGELQTDDVEYLLSWLCAVVLGPLTQCHGGRFLCPCVHHINHSPRSNQPLHILDSELTLGQST